MPDFTLTDTVLIGAEASFGEHAKPGGAREIICKLVADHPDKEGAEIFSREQWAGISGMSVGTSINLATQVTPMTGVFLFLVDKNGIVPTITINGETQDIAVSLGAPVQASPANIVSTEQPVQNSDDVTADLVDLAWTRSGDKGHLFNVAVIAREPEYLPFIQSVLTEAAISKWYAHLGPEGQPPRVEMFEAPGLNALNFVIHEALTGGINASTQLDPAAKGMGQMLLRFPVRIPAVLAKTLKTQTHSNGGQNG